MLDITIILVFIIFFWWFFILIPIIYIISIQSPLFYISKRAGRKGNEFSMIKFRTLAVNDKLPLHQRRFWLGNFLRFTNLDELPQLWNVLKGEMSLVGPRPLPVAYLPLMSEEQKKRFQVRPGITGLAQVNGKNSLSWEEKFEYDLAYLSRISLTTDVQILLKTMLLMLSMKKDVSLMEGPLK